MIQLRCAFPSLPSLVVGREAAFAELRQRLGLGSDMRSLTVIRGWPGIGKFTIVAVLARAQSNRAHIAKCPRFL